MPESKGEPKAAPESAGGSAPALISKKGWVVVVVIVLVEAAFFSSLVLIRGTDKVADSGEKEKPAQGEEADRIISRKHVPIDQLTYSVAVTPSTNANLMISIDLILGRTQDEIRQKIAPSDKDQAAFESAVKAMVPSIKNRLIGIVSDQTFASLTKGQGREDVLAKVKE